MNVLCPDCQSSVPVTPNDPWLRCPSCGLQADLSRLETSPGMASLPLVQDLAGEDLAGYRLEALVGVGGMGVVYRATREGDDTPVAVKVLHGDYHHQQEAFVERFRREARALSKLDHPGIVRLLDSGQEGELHYLVTEFVDGRNLAQVLRDGPLPLERAVDIVTRVCDALDYAHAEGVVHRDVKPANILIAGDEVKVVDFGLAQITGWESTLSSLTRTNLAMGTFNYLSPEQRVSAKEVDGRSDLFSLGVVLYEAVLGELPVGAFASPSKQDPRLPRRLDRIVSRVLAVDPADRHQDAAALAADLRLLITARGVPKVALAAAVLALVVGLGGGLAYWAWPGDPPKTRAPAMAQSTPVAVDAGPAVETDKDDQGLADNKGVANAPSPSTGVGNAEASTPAANTKPAPTSAPPNPYLKYQEAQAFFASVGGKGGARPGPPPGWTLKGEPELRQAWQHYWALYQAQRANRRARQPSIKGSFGSQGSFGTKKGSYGSKGSFEGKGRKVKRRRTKRVRRPAPVRKRSIKQIWSIARKFGFPVKGTPGPPPLKLRKAYPRVYAFWERRYLATRKTPPRARPAPRRAPARPRPRLRPTKGGPYSRTSFGK